MLTKDGKKHTEKFSLLTKNGEVNERAVNVFSSFAKTALNNFSLDEIDHEDLLGCYISGTITHEEFESNKNPGQMRKSAKLNNWTPAAGFGTGEAKSKVKAVEEDEDEDDLNAFLDD